METEEKAEVTDVKDITDAVQEESSPNALLLRNGVTAETYERAARIFESLQPHQCNPLTYKMRMEFASNMRRFAAEPKKKGHMLALNSMRFFIYTSDVY